MYFWYQNLFYLRRKSVHYIYVVQLLMVVEWKCYIISMYEWYIDTYMYAIYMMRYTNSNSKTILMEKQT